MGYARFSYRAGFDGGCLFYALLRANLPSSYSTHSSPLLLSLLHVPPPLCVYDAALACTPWNLFYYCSGSMPVLMCFEWQIVLPPRLTLPTPSLPLQRRGATALFLHRPPRVRRVQDTLHHQGSKGRPPPEFPPGQGGVQGGLSVA